MCHAPVHEEFDTCDVAAVVRREEHGGFGDLVWVSHASERNSADEGSLDFPRLFSGLGEAVLQARGVRGTWTEGVDADFALLQVEGPQRAKERMAAFEAL